MTPFPTLAAAQTIPVRGDVEANIAQHLRLVAAAAEAGAQVIVFPELSLTGYELDLARALAFRENDDRLAPLGAAAASAAITLVVGAPVLVGARLHLAALILFPNGATELYTKHRLGAFGESARRDGIVPPPEATVFEPGDRNPLLHFGDATAALAVCADTGGEWHPGQAAARGAVAYLASMFVIPSEFDADSAKLGGYAARYAMAVVAANYGGPTGGLAAAGRSSIWSDRGDLLVRLPSEGAGVAVATRDPAGRWTAAALALDEPARRPAAPGR
jgi:predicted amidohydrolase